MVFTSQFGGWEGGSLRLLTSLHHWSAETASPASLMVKWELGGKGGLQQSRIGHGLDQRRGRQGGDRRRRRGLLTLCLNSDFSSRVMVSAFAITGMMFTTLLRCLMNSRSRGRKLRPEMAGCQSHLALPHPTTAASPGPPLGQEEGAGSLAEAQGLLRLLPDTLPASHRLQNRLRLSAPTRPPVSPSLQILPLLQDSAPDVGIFFSWE